MVLWSAEREVLMHLSWWCLTVFRRWHNRSTSVKGVDFPRHFRVLFLFVGTTNLSW